MKLFKFKFSKFYILLIIIFSVLSAGLSITYPVIIGNLIDRVFRGYVIDYIYFNLKKFPVFNLSDFYIIIGAILFAF